MRSLEPGDVFAQSYKLVRFIDAGGFADVWEARALNAAEHTAALKIYPRLNEEGLKTIEREYLLQANLLHSHLLIAKHFNSDGENPFFEMIYCSGGNASAKIGEYTEREVAQLIHQICSAIKTFIHN